MKRILLASCLTVLASVSFGSPAYACWPWDGACQARERAAQQRAQQQAAQRAAAAQRQNQINSNLVKQNGGRVLSDNGLGFKNNNNNLISNNQNGLLSPGNKTGSSLISPGNKTGSSFR
jgi:flagellar basal body-associated protein FliL